MKKLWFYIFLLTLGCAQFAQAQLQEPFSIRFSQTLNGDFTTVGNNMIARHATNPYTGNGNNHDFNNNVYVDIDADATTFNSSSANFTDPGINGACIDIFRAYLYWAAVDVEQPGGGDNQPNWNFDDVKLMMPGETTYTTYTADDVIFRGRTTHFSNDPYICVKDITNEVLALSNKFGNYQVANVEAAEGTVAHDPMVGTTGGWQIVFVYESQSLPSKNITLFDGYAHVTNIINDIDINFSGFQTTPVGNVNANMVIGALEGDRGLNGDRLRILDASNNFVDITAPQRTANNFFNSRITDENGNFLDRVPASTNTLGFDAAVFELDNPGNTVITNNQTSATVRISSQNEVYGLYLLGLAVEVYSPSLNPLVITQTSGSNPANAGDILGFDFTFENTGNDNAVNTTLNTVIPPQATFLTPTNLPAGVTYTYNAGTGDLQFSVADGLLDVGDPAVTIPMELQVNGECYFLEDDCTLSFDLQFTATYEGAQFPGVITTVSTADPTSCVATPYTVNINQPVVNWLTAAGALNVTLDCDDTTGLAQAQALEPEPDKCIFTLNKTSGPFVPGSCPSTGTYTNTWNFTDACGVTIADYVQVITITDTEAPTASNPPAINVACVGDVPAPDPNVVTDEADNCSVPVVAFVSDVSDNQTCPETITRTYSVTDACGNATTVTQQIIIQDDILPTASNPAPLNVSCISEVPAPNPDVVTDEADNCGTPSVVFVSEVTDNQSCPETITRTYSVTDTCGNSINVTHQVVIQDDTPPTASNPAAVNVQCIDDVPAPDPAVVTDAADNCGTPLVSFVSDVSDNQSCPETISRTYSITDACGNFTEVVQQIIIMDDIAPTASNPPAMVLECDGSVPPPDPSVVTDASDNCGSPIVAFVSDVSDNQSCPETITRTYSVTDTCGNLILVEQTLILMDETPPQLDSTLEPEIEVNCGDIPDVPQLQFIDNCSDNPFVEYFEELVELNDLDYNIIRNWVVTDDCDNQNTYTQTVMIRPEVDFAEISIELCPTDDPVNLESLVENTSNLSGEWTGDHTDQLDGTVLDPSGFDYGTFSFTYTYIENDCEWTTVIEVSVTNSCGSFPCIPSKDDVSISKLVSANNDGYNDFFEVNYILDPNGTTNCDIVVEVEIFNRWGARVYKDDNYQNDWYGASPSGAFGDATLLPTGTYYYVVTLRNSGFDPIQGFILLGTE